MKKIIITIFLCLSAICAAIAQSADKHDQYLTRADSFFQDQQYNKAAKYYNKAFNLKVADEHFHKYATDLYKAAYANAATDQVTSAFIYLNQLVNEGQARKYVNLETDPAFSNLHRFYAWQQLRESIIAGKFKNTYDQAINHELMDISTQKIQQNRKIDSLTNLFGETSTRILLLKDSINVSDKLNLARVKSIIYSYGWLGPDDIGLQANQIMFNVILNADDETGKKYLDIVWQAFKKKHATADNYAQLADKVALVESKKQIYGSVIKKVGTAYAVAPIMEEQYVNARRKEIGLIPLEDYLKQFDIIYSVK